MAAIKQMKNLAVRTYRHKRDNDWILQHPTEIPFEDPIPFGSQGRYIKMNSGGSLEQEMIIGPEADTNISKTGNGTTIIDCEHIGRDFNGFSYFVETKVYPKTIEVNGDTKTVIEDIVHYFNEHETFHVATKETVITKTAAGDTSIEERISYLEDDE